MMVFIVISVIGRGLKSGDNFELLYKLAEKLNVGIHAVSKSIQCVGGHVGLDLV